jgi:glycosyltransferase involved in cell wall biosynthesis
MNRSRQINILHLRSCRGVGGGPEKTILFSAREVDREEFSLHIAYLKSQNDPLFDLHERAAKMGVEKFITIDERFKFDVGALRTLLKILRERNIDILHCHCYKSDLYGLILSRFHKMKLVTTAHGPLATMRFFWASQNWRVRYIYDQIDLRILRYFDAVIMVSDTMRPIISRYGVDQKRLLWVRNAIDSHYFQRNESVDREFRDRLQIPHLATVIGAVGRLNGEKDYPNFLDAAKLLLGQRPDVFFVIAGQGELEQELIKRTAALGIGNRVKFLGHFHDVRKVYELIDVYVLSSTREGLPNTILEAMAMRVPIVATDVDGVKEAVTDRKEALLVPPRNPSALANGILTILDNPRLATELTVAARAKVEEEFSFATRMRRIENIYRSVMQQAGHKINEGQECAREYQEI